MSFAQPARKPQDASAIRVRMGKANPPSHPEETGRSLRLLSRRPVVPQAVSTQESLLVIPISNKHF
jgi:hypothetical protein